MSTRRRRWSTTGRACLVGASILAASFVQSDVHADPSWIATTSYPGGSFYAGSCVASDGIIYCIGGTSSDQVWYAPLDAAAVGPWRQTTPYGEGGTNHGLSCGIDGGSVYCVGGMNQQGASDDVTSDVWFAPLTSSGVGAWQPTVGYGASAISAAGGRRAGIDIWAHSCVTNAGFIYCIGGLERTDASSSRDGSDARLGPLDTPTDAVRYAPVSSSGVGAWRTTSSFGEPVWGHSCVTSNGYIYCVGGSTGTAASTSDAWYAQIQGDGELGPWTFTTSYGGGAVDGLSCAAVGQQIYCVGGATREVWSAPLSRFGVGAWTRQQDYPAGSWNPSCVSDTSAVYCVGGSADRTSGGTPSAAVSAYSTRPVQNADGGSAANTDTDPGDAFHVATVGNPSEPVLKSDPVATERSVRTAGHAGRVTPPTANQTAAIVGGPGVLTNAGSAGEECASIASGIISSGHAKCHSAATTVALDPSSASYGITVTVTAVVSDTSDSPAPLGDAVAFSDNGAGGTFSVGACHADHEALACSATYSVPDAGKQVTITVTHQDSLHTRSLGTAVLTLTGSSPKITVMSSANPAVVGETIHFIASISPVDGGSGKVAFDVDGVALSSPKAQVASDSRATSGTTSTLPVGIHMVTAAFSGGVSLNEKVGLIAPGSGTMAQQVIGELKDESSCQALGGSWTWSSETCAVSSLTVDQTNSFQIGRGITLANTNGTIAINQGGIIVNRGRITNSGRQSAVRPSTIAISAGGSLTNVGAVSNLAIVVIDPGARFTNRGVILNECGETTPGSGTVSGTVSGTPPMNRCDTAEPGGSPSMLPSADSRTPIVVPPRGDRSCALSTCLAREAHLESLLVRRVRIAPADGRSRKRGTL